MVFSGQVYFPNRARNLSFLIPDSWGSYSQIFKKHGKCVQCFNLPTCGQCCISLCFDKSLHFLWPERRRVYFPLVPWPQPDRKMVSFSVLWLLRRVQKSEPNITWRKQACEHEICSGVIFWSQLLKSDPRIFNDSLDTTHLSNSHWNQWNYFHWCQHSNIRKNAKESRKASQMLQQWDQRGTVFSLAFPLFQTRVLLGSRATEASLLSWDVGRTCGLVLFSNSVLSKYMAEWRMCNSLCALRLWLSIWQFCSHFWLWVLFVLLGGFLGSFGSHFFPNQINSMTSFSSPSAQTFGLA